MHIIGILSEEREKRRGEIFETIVTENIPKLCQTLNHRSSEPKECQIG